MKNAKPKYSFLLYGITGGTPKKDLTNSRARHCELRGTKQEARYETAISGELRTYGAHWQLGEWLSTDLMPLRVILGPLDGRLTATWLTSLELASFWRHIWPGIADLPLNQYRIGVDDWLNTHWRLTECRLRDSWIRIVWILSWGWFRTEPALDLYWILVESSLDKHWILVGSMSANDGKSDYRLSGVFHPISYLQL